MGFIDFAFGKQIQKRVTAISGQLTQRIATNLVNQNLYRYIGDNMPLLNEDCYDYVDGGYKAVGAVYECVSAILNKVISCPRIVYEVKDETKYKQYKSLALSTNPNDIFKAKQLKSESLTEVKVDRINNLLNNPNPEQDGDSYFELLAGSYLLNGNAFIYGNDGDGRSKKWTEMWALPQMHIISGGIMKPVKEYYLFWNTDAQTRFDASNVKHIKAFNPKFDLHGSQLYGLSPLRAYLYDLDLLREADKRADKQLKNGTEFGIISPKNKEDQFDDDQRKAFKESLVRGYDSDDALSQWFPVSVPLEFERIGLSIADLDLINLKKASQEDIYRAYKRPLAFLNQDAATYNNLSTANKQFIREAVAPVCEKISHALTQFICEPYKRTDGKVYIIRLDYTQLPEMQSDMKELTEWLNKAWWLTPNQRREALGYGKNEEPGMDSVWIPTNMTRLEDAVNGNSQTTTVQDVNVV